jgi:hypothetical protein
MDISNIFQDQTAISKIQNKLPELFYIAELESSRAGNIGMEVGSLREKILIAFLIYQFGSGNVETDLPITKSEMDVIVFGRPLSIKTVTRRRLGGVKLIWTVDAEQAHRFYEGYFPSCDMLLTQINWGGPGGLYLFTRELQIETLQTLGREAYIILPRQGTNPRGVEISSTALNILASHPNSFRIPVQWVRKNIAFDPYKRWVDLWEQD